jgi:hypothetical protein
LNSINSDLPTRLNSIILAVLPTLSIAYRFHSTQCLHQYRHQSVRLYQLRSRHQHLLQRNTKTLNSRSSVSVSQSPVVSLSVPGKCSQLGRQALANTASFVVKKKGLIASTKKYGNAAGEGVAYLKSWLWWTGETFSCCEHKS